MKRIGRQDGVLQRVYEAVVDEICAGALAEGPHLVQERTTMRLGVSPQPVQQAMARLKADGLVAEVGRRGLTVTPFDLETMGHRYDVRAALDALAAKRAGSEPDFARSLAARGAAILERGAVAASSRATTEQIRFDMEFHGLIFAASGNPMLAGAAKSHWRFLRWAIGAILRFGALPGEIWRQHGEILHAVLGGQAARAERLAMDHDTKAARTLSAARAAAWTGKDAP